MLRTAFRPLFKNKPLSHPPPLPPTPYLRCPRRQPPPPPVSPFPPLVPTWYRCELVSAHVWCRSTSGAPDSSNWPPGSSVTDWPSYDTPMMRPPSTMGSQPNLHHGRVHACSAAVRAACEACPSAPAAPPAARRRRRLRLPSCGWDDAALLSHTCLPISYGCATPAAASASFF
eukprot:365398-Chlamydomonas_euryale.AAC.6